MACRFPELVVDSLDPEAPAASRAEVRAQDAEPARLLAPGRTRADVGRSGTEGRHVPADPEGNEPCLLRRRLDPL